MLFSPVNLQTVEPILEIVRANPEFQHGVDPSGKIGYISYAVAFAHTFPPMDTGIEASLRRECKSLMYDLQTLKILSRRQHKFFNLGEREETRPENIDWSQEHIVLEKLDGSSISPVLVESENRIYWCTKRGITSLSDLLNPFIVENPKYERFARACIEKNLSPCLEWCGPRHKIILDYKEENLIVTTIRHNETGLYMDYDSMVELAVSYDIPVVRKLRGKINNLDEFLSFVREAKNIEGFVIRFDQDMLKVKSLWYLQIHKMLDNLKFEKDVLRIVLDNQIDDVLPFVMPEIRDRLVKFNDKVLKGICDTVEKVSDFVESVKNIPRKELASLLNSDENMKPYRKMIFDSFDVSYDRNLVGEKIRGNVMKQLNNSCFSGPRVDENRHLIGGARWIEEEPNEDDLDSSE